MEGLEFIGVCGRNGLAATGAYDKDQDVTFYKEPEFSGQVLLRKDDYVVLSPEDAHKPRCLVGAAMPVTKIVVKVPVQK